MRDILNRLLARYNIPLPIAILGLFLLIGIVILGLILLPTTKAPTPTLPTPTQTPAQTIPTMVISPTYPPGYSTPTPNPDAYYQNNPSYTENVDKISAQEKTNLSKDALVSKFIDSLPYRGANIYIYYTISDNVVHLEINKSNQTLGNDEFNSLLKQRGIGDKSWFVGFETTTK